MSNKQFNVFSYANAIQIKRNIPFDEKIANGYMLLLHFSHCNKYLEYLDKLNRYMFIHEYDNETVYKYLFNAIPKGREYIKWVKKNKVSDADVSDIMNKYGCSKREALEVLCN